MSNLKTSQVKKILCFITPSVPFKKDNTSLDQKSTYFIPQPLGLCYLGKVLKQKGYEVETCDVHIENYEKYDELQDIQIFKDKLIEKINSTEFDLAAISSPYIYTYEWAHYIASLIKEKNSELPVVVGNGYASLLQEELLKDKNIDFVQIGEGDESFLELLKYLNSRDSKVLKNIDGIVYREDEEIIINPKVNFIQNVDDIPFPDWGLVDYEKYFKYNNRRTMIMVSSRGCPYTCTFCNSYESWGRGFRKRSAENVLKEIDYLIDNFQIENVFFVDDNMTVDKERFMKIAKGIKERTITWDIANISSFTTDEEMLVAMKESGCHQISISVESASPRVLKEMRKPVNLKRTKELAELCRKIGLKCRLNYIIGLPYETKEDVLTTLKYSEEVRGDWNQYSILIPYPGTDIYKYCIKNDYFIDKNIDFSKFNQRQVFIENEHWDKDWIQSISYEYNIRTNFLNNYNLVEAEGLIDNVIEDLEYVARFIPEHLIANICLAYAYNKKGNREKVDYYIKKTEELFKNPEVMKIYGKYLGFKYKVLEFYRGYKCQKL